MEILIPIVLLVAALLVGERLAKTIGYWMKPAQERALLERAKRARPVQGGVPQRGALKGCSNCGVASLTLPYRDGSGATYCSDVCLIWAALGPTDYCQACLQQTSDESPGDMNRMNGIGRGFGGAGQRCPRCRSVVRRVWFTFFFVPLIPLGQYRVIQASPTEFYARRTG